MMNKSPENDHDFYWNSFKQLVVDYYYKTGEFTQKPFVRALRLIDVMARWDADAASAETEAGKHAKEYLLGNAATFTRNYLDTFSPSGGFYAAPPCSPQHSFVLRLGLSVLHRTLPPDG